MAKLIKNIEASLFNDISDDVVLVKSVIGQIQQEDYINLSSLTGMIQNFSRIEVTELITTPLYFGLPNTYNLTVNTLNIDY